MTQLTICNVKITTDANGFYRLNDLHKASGGEARTEPGQWLRNQKTQDFIKVCETETMQKCIVSTVGRNGGTYISKKLVYHYAMWVSPEFTSHVIETFDALMTGKLQTPEPISKDDLLDQLYLQYVAEREATKHLVNKVEAQQPAVEFVQKMANSNGTMELDDFCKA